MSSKKADQRSAVAPVRSTSGAGFAFEDLIGAWLLQKLLSGEAVPGMRNGLGVRLQFQTAALGWRLTFRQKRI